MIISQQSLALTFRTFASSHLPPSSPKPQHNRLDIKEPAHEIKKPRASLASDEKKNDKSGGPRIKELEFKMETTQHDLETKLKKAKKWLLERHYRVEVSMSYRSEGEKKVEKEAALERFKSVIGQLTTSAAPGGGPQPEAKSIAHLVNLPTKSSFKVMILPPPPPPLPSTPPPRAAESHTKGQE